MTWERPKLSVFATQEAMTPKEFEQSYNELNGRINVHIHSTQIIQKLANGSSTGKNWYYVYYETK